MGNHGEKVRFCYHCGVRLEADADFCVKCGAKIVRQAMPSPNQTANVSGERSKRSFGMPGRKFWMFVAWVLVPVVALTLVGWLAFYRTLPTKGRDLLMVSGCPEVEDLTFSMTKSQVEACLKKYDPVERDGVLAVDTGVNLYRIPVRQLLCEFREDQLSSIELLFSEQETSVEELGELYGKLYGEPDLQDEYTCVWVGNHTTIKLIENFWMPAKERLISVYYVQTVEPEHPRFVDYWSDSDPFNLLLENTFSQTIDPFVAGLQQGYDYRIQEETGQIRYVFQLDFSYLDLPPENCSVSLNLQDGRSRIGAAQYDFTTELSRIPAVYNRLAEDITGRFGDCSACSFIRPSDRLGEELSLRPDEMTERLEKARAGTYWMVWEYDGCKIQLRILLEEGESVCRGFVRYVG